jgi:hypothetical protein
MPSAHCLADPRVNYKRYIVSALLPEPILTGAPISNGGARASRFSTGALA